jgi:predicted secreted protein with PEFG-CTERM motif
MTALPVYTALAQSQGIYEENQLARFSDVPVRVWTDSQVYDHGSIINVEGVVKGLRGEGIPITITIRGPQNNLVEIRQVEIADDLTFKTSFSTAGALFKQNGMYTIRAQYDKQEINDKVVIELKGIVKPQVTKCSEGEITVRSNTDAYCVPFSAEGLEITDATVSRETKSIVLMIDAKSDGILTLTIPRNILDSQSDDGDSPFIVLVDDDEGEVFEVSSDATVRTLEIDVPEGATQIEIVGTFAVPEFGTMAAIILAVAIVSIIAVSARSRLGILPKY